MGTFLKASLIIFFFSVFEGQFLHCHHYDDEYMDKYSKIQAKEILYLDLSSWKFQRISNGIERGQFNSIGKFSSIGCIIFYFCNRRHERRFAYQSDIQHGSKSSAFLWFGLGRGREIHAKT